MAVAISTKAFFSLGFPYSRMVDGRIPANYIYFELVFTRYSLYQNGGRGGLRSIIQLRCERQSILHSLFLILGGRRASL